MNMNFLQPQKLTITDYAKTFGISLKTARKNYKTDLEAICTILGIPFRARCFMLRSDLRLLYGNIRVLSAKRKNMQ